MSHHPLPSQPLSSTLDDLADSADYSLLEALTEDPDATRDGNDHDPRQVFSGHYVPVKPTPLPNPEYVAHSRELFAELGFSDSLAHTPEFQRFFSGDLSVTSSLASGRLKDRGWATGYALSIFGQELIQQCPFRTGNGYGDGRAISVLEGRFNGRRWEMQLKGGGRTPYCRGGDGRAVLRSSVREFLAQEHMHALGVPTSRSLSLLVSRSESIQRPWYSEGSTSANPDMLVLDPAAISTRVAPSFLRVGQLELFARRVRNNAHPRAVDELEEILCHILDRHYRSEISSDIGLGEQLVHLAELFRERLCSLVAEWLRVGYCQGNFNSDNCALGGFTLDYGPFGFMERFDPEYQPWTGGGRHFAFFNQPEAALRNYQMFWKSLSTWPGFTETQSEQLETIRSGFADVMLQKLDEVWMAKLGLASPNTPLAQRLFLLMQQTSVDYTIFFRVLSDLPRSIEPLRASFYPSQVTPGVSPASDEMWQSWLQDWRATLSLDGAARGAERVAKQMKTVNPKYTLREWQLVPAYVSAADGDYELLRELQVVMTRPYDDQDSDTEKKYAALRPAAYFGMGGVSHMSCSS